MNVLKYFQKDVQSDEPIATETDLYYCYRLLLGRTPDPAGLASWKRHLKVQRPSVRSVVHSFMQSGEYHQNRELKQQPLLVTLPDFKIYVHDTDASIGAVIARHGKYEPAVEAVIRSVLQPGDTFIDLGANIGFFSLLAARLVGPTGRVIAFEPNIENCTLLLKSTQENNFKNIEIFPLAVGETRRSMVLEVGSGLSNGKVVSSAATPNSTVVGMVALDNFLADLAGAKLIKMDIEGSEPRALRGMEKLLARFRPSIVFEFSPGCIREVSEGSEEEFLHQIESLGYVIRLAKRPDFVLRTTEILQAIRKTDDHHLDLFATPI